MNSWKWNSTIFGSEATLRFFCSHSAQLKHREIEFSLTEIEHRILLFDLASNLQDVDLSLWMQEGGGTALFAFFFGRRVKINCIWPEVTRVNVTRDATTSWKVFVKDALGIVGQVYTLIPWYSLCPPFLLYAIFKFQKRRSARHTATHEKPNAYLNLSFSLSLSLWSN